MLLSIGIGGLIIQHHSPTSDKIVIGFAGDTMLGRLVNETVSAMPKEHRYQYPLGNVLSLLQKNDINIVNLETTLTESTQIVPKVFNFKATPDKVNILKEGHIDIVNIANNHILDFSDQGLIETIQTLDAAGIAHVGAGLTINQAKKPVMITKKNIRIGIIGYTDNEPDWLATNNKPGTNYIHVGDIQTIKQDIAKIRNHVDLLILTIHWGPNMRQQPTQEFIDFAHAIIEAGVDIMHGHSAHIFQGIEIYNNKVIFYDTGDFIDDYATDPYVRNDQSFLFNVTITKNGINNIKLIPVIINNMQVNKAEDNDKDEILQKIASLSAKFGTHIQYDTIFLKNP